MSQPRRIPYRPGLDGLRGLSVAAVLCFHGEFGWASGGFLGVSSFFVLSGFLITTLLLVERAESGGIRLGAFWARRFRRLMPAALLCLAGVALFGYAVAEAGTLVRLRADALSALFYVANWRFMTSGLAYEQLFGEPSPVQHFWSLAIEEQFYLLYPPLVAGLLALDGGRRRALAIAVASLAAASALAMAILFVPERPASRVYYGTDTRAAELLVGALLAIVLAPGRPRAWLERPLVQWLGAAALVSTVGLFAVASPHSSWLFRGGFAVASVATGAVIAACLRPGPVASLLGVAPLRELGRVSYGVYLYHWPVFLWLTPRSTDLSGATLFALQTAVTLALATLSYYAVERPIRHGGRLPGFRALAAGLAAAGSVAAAVVVVTRDPPIPWSLSFVAGPRPMPRVPADGGGPPRVMVMGDSVGWTVGAGLERWGRTSLKIKAWNLANLGCGLARGGEVERAHGIVPSEPVCDGWADWWPARVKAYRPAVAVVLSGTWDLVERRLPEWRHFRALGDPLFDDWLVGEYIEVVDVLSARGARVVWLTAPCVDESRRHSPLEGTKALSAERIDHLNLAILPRVAAARRDRVILFDLYARVCPGDELLLDIGKSEPLRPDGLHFSKPGADWLARRLGPLLLEIATGRRSPGKSRDFRARPADRRGPPSHAGAPGGHSLDAGPRPVGKGKAGKAEGR